MENENVLSATIVSLGLLPYDKTIEPEIRKAYQLYIESQDDCGYEHLGDNPTPSQKRTRTIRFSKLLKVIENTGRDTINTVAFLGQEAPIPE